jgi:hypothetical protein
MLKEYAVSVFEVEVEVKAAGFSKKWKTMYQHTRCSNAVEHHTNNDVSSNKIANQMHTQL